MFREAALQANQARLWFDHVGGGLQAKDGKLAGFTVAGKDANFVPAEARIEGDTVVVTSPAMAAIAAVRYAWEDNPAATLYNREGLPASPFRTDAYPGK